MMITRDMIMLRLIIVVFVTHLSSDLLSQDTDSLKCWSSENRLKWSDFKGSKPKDQNSSNLSAASGYRLLTVPFLKNDLLRYRVNLAFEKYDSWKTDTADYLLAHERLHFDIGELCARKLRKAIREIEEKIPNPTKQDFQPVFQKLYAENASMQDAYDKDTAHGIIAESQAAWKKKVCLELMKLKEYASTPADCK